MGVPSGRIRGAVMKRQPAHDHSWMLHALAWSLAAFALMVLLLCSGKAAGDSSSDDAIWPKADLMQGSLLCLLFRGIAGALRST